MIQYMTVLKTPLDYKDHELVKFTDFIPNLILGGKNKFLRIKPAAIKMLRMEADQERRALDTMYKNIDVVPEMLGGLAVAIMAIHKQERFGYIIEQRTNDHIASVAPEIRERIISLRITQSLL